MRKPQSKCGNGFMQVLIEFSDSKVAIICLRFVNNCMLYNLLMDFNCWMLQVPKLLKKLKTKYILFYLYRGKRSMNVSWID